MNCPEWEQRIAEGDGEAGEHVRSCAACSEFAAGLERDAALLRMAPPEAAMVDYAAIRARARRAVVQRGRRRKWLAALAVAAALLLAMRLTFHREVSRPVAGIPVAPPVAPVARAASPSPTVPAPRYRRPKPAPDLDRQFADFLRAQYRLQHPAAAPAGTIATGNPNVTILLLEESKGEANE